MSFPELMPDYEPHKVREVYLMQWENPNLWVDITDVIDLKIKALAATRASSATSPGWKSACASARRSSASQGLRVRGDLRPDRPRAMIKYWPALASVALSFGAIVAYYSFCACPPSAIIRASTWRPFALAAAIAAVGALRAPRWPNLAALAVSLALLILGGYFNLVLAQVPPRPATVRVGQAAPDFTLPDAKGAPVTLASFRAARRRARSSTAATGDPSACRSSTGLERFSRAG